MTGCAPRSPRRGRAVDAAVAAQRALELPVRMGLATGEAELRDGDYFGTVLNRAARVMAAGHGGQILVADSTAVLLSGVDLVDLGPRRLRDLPIAGRGVPGPSAGPAHGVSAVADAGRDAGEPAACRPPASSGASPRSTEVQAAVAGTSAGDADRGGRGGQDPPGDGGRGASWPTSSPTGSGFSSWPRSPIRRRCPTRWPRCWASPSSRARA